MSKIFYIIVLVIIIFTASCYSAQRGDLVFYGSEMVEPSHERYLNQSRRLYMQAVAMNSHKYDSLKLASMSDIKTWDDTIEPLGSKYWWFHVELLNDNEIPAIVADKKVIVRLKQGNARFYVDIDEALSLYGQLREGVYNQPLIPAIYEDIRGIEWVTDAIGHWLHAYDIDIIKLYKQGDIAVQWSPMVYGYQQFDVSHTDIDSKFFWMRDWDCSSRAFWALIGGWHEATGNGRAVFFDRIDRVNAVDSISPGVLGWWLINSGLAEVVDTQ